MLNQRETQEKEVSKKRKLEEGGVVWGEQVPEVNKAKVEFLMGPNNTVVSRNLVQKTITPLTRTMRESMTLMNEIITMAIQWSEEGKELRMAEDALKDEPEWSLENNENRGGSAPGNPMPPLIKVPTVWERLYI